MNFVFPPTEYIEGGVEKAINRRPEQQSGMYQ